MFVGVCLFHNKQVELINGIHLLFLWYARAYEVFHMKVETQKLSEGDLTFYVTFIEIENAVFAFYTTTDNPKLGTLAVAIPQPKDGLSVSSVLLGERNSVLTKILAERLSQFVNKITFASTHFDEISDNQSGRLLLRLTQQIGSATIETS
jgi:hypothetical protein